MLTFVAGLFHEFQNMSFKLIWKPIAVIIYVIKQQKKVCCVLQCVDWV